MHADRAARMVSGPILHVEVSIERRIKTNRTVSLRGIAVLKFSRFQQHKRLDQRGPVLFRKFEIGGWFEILCKHVVLLFVLRGVKH